MSVAPRTSDQRKANQLINRIIDSLEQMKAAPMDDERFEHWKLFTMVNTDFGMLKSMPDINIPYGNPIFGSIESLDLLINRLRKRAGGGQYKTAAVKNAYKEYIPALDWALQNMNLLKTKVLHNYLNNQPLENDDEPQQSSMMPQGYNTAMPPPGYMPQGYPAGMMQQGYGAAMVPQGYGPPQGYGGVMMPQGYGGAMMPQGYGGATMQQRYAAPMVPQRQFSDEELQQRLQSAYEQTMQGQLLLYQNYGVPIQGQPLNQPYGQYYQGQQPMAPPQYGQHMGGSRGPSQSNSRTNYY